MDGVFQPLFEHGQVEPLRGQAPSAASASISRSASAFLQQPTKLLLEGRMAQTKFVPADFQQGRVAAFKFPPNRRPPNIARPVQFRFRGRANRRDGEARSPGPNSNSAGEILLVLGSASMKSSWRRCFSCPIASSCLPRAV